MKKKLVVLAMTFTIAVGILAGCGQKNAAKTAEATEQTVEGEQTEDSEEDNSEVGKLIEKENKILMDHQKAWEKVFEKVDKTQASKKMEEGQTYLDFLKESIENVKDSLAEDEKEQIEKDMVEIEKIETQLSEMNIGQEGEKQNEN